jgi:hypothetical protein
MPVGSRHEKKTKRLSETWIRTEHERVRIKRCEGDEQAAKAASYIRELGFLSRSSKGGIVRVPFNVVRRRRVHKIVVREGICVRALPVVPFLQM